MENLEEQISADEAMERLVAGNGRFAAGQPTGLGSYRYNIADLTEGQRPYATIFGCSDSRVPPELVFDAGLGELFVIRVAGNVLSAEVAGSLQYAGSHLKTRLFVVMGHTGCGAVAAALDSICSGTRHRSRIQVLVDSIVPLIAGLDTDRPPAELLDSAVENNVRRTVQQIMATPEAQARQSEGIYRIVGAIYDIATGRVKFLEL